MSRSETGPLRRIVVAAGYATDAQIEAMTCAAEAASPPAPPLEFLLVESGLRSHEQIADLLTAHAGVLAPLDPRLNDRIILWRQAGEAIRRRWAPPDRVRQALREHARREARGASWLPLGQLMAELGLLRALGGSEIVTTPDQAPTTPARRPTESHASPPDQSAPTARVPFPPPGYAPIARTAGKDTQSRPRPLAGDSAPAEPLFPGPRHTSTRSRMVGRWIGPWWVLDELGRGGMGVVYKARDAEGTRIVALKVLHEREAASPQVAQRFRTEAEVMAQLRHPGIVAVYDIGQSATYTWIAMEFVAGVTLDRLLQAPTPDHLSLEEGARDARRPLPAPEAVDIIRQVAEAVQAAHDTGVVHRDLKLANVLREPSGRVKVMDFGLAKVLDTRAGNLTRSGVLMGTPGYMSPEMAEGKSAQVDGRSDIYQMGAMLYELTTAHPPYEGSAALETVMRIAGGEAPAPPTRWAPGLDLGVQQIIATAMARNPDRRFATARALADACARWLLQEHGR